MPVFNQGDRIVIVEPHWHMNPGEEFIVDSYVEEDEEGPHYKCRKVGDEDAPFADWMVDVERCIRVEQIPDEIVYSNFMILYRRDVDLVIRSVTEQTRRDAENSVQQIVRMGYNILATKKITVRIPQ